MSIVEKMARAYVEYNRKLHEEAARVEDYENYEWAELGALMAAALTATGLTEAQLEGLANGAMVVVPVVPVEPMFPIMKGPAVPWALIAPYEAQARENHGQSLKRLAERGGLSISEAMAIMSEAAFRDRPIEKPTVEQWLDFIAERKRRAARRAMLAAKEG